ncbi:MAG: hypothetical protein FD134_1211 [Gallionellaceae bacterium]|nr:MAG: hypothetical protein FD134_1211 [Gallionellaceae bacterium]
MKTATTRRTAPAKLSAKEREYLDSLSPKHRKIHLLAKPLTGKLTKALHVK